MSSVSHVDDQARARLVRRHHRAALVVGRPGTCGSRIPPSRSRRCSSRTARSRTRSRDPRPPPGSRSERSFPPSVRLLPSDERGQMIRVFVLYGEEPDPQRYAQHVELCERVPGATFRHGKVFGAPMGEPKHRYYAELELPDMDAFKAAARSPEFMATGKDAMGWASAFTVEFADVVASAELRRPLLAHGGDALVDVGARHVEELERERRVERGARCAQPVVERELRVPDRGLRPGREPRARSRARAPRARPPARRARRARCAPPRRRRAARRAAGGTSPSRARRGAATRSPRGRRRRRRASCGRRRSARDGVAIEMSASSPTARPAPTAGPVIADTIGFGQLTTL